MTLGPNGESERKSIRSRLSRGGHSRTLPTAPKSFLFEDFETGSPPLADLPVPLLPSW